MVNAPITVLILDVLFWAPNFLMMAESLTAWWAEWLVVVGHDPDDQELIGLKFGRTYGQLWALPSAVQLFLSSSPLTFGCWVSESAIHIMKCGR